jgi:Na+/phosphate symporter
MGKKELLLALHENLASLIEGLDLLYMGLIFNEGSVIEKAALTVDPVEDAVRKLGEAIRDESARDASLNPYLGIPDRIRDMRERILIIGRNLYTRKKEDVLFSDRATTELEYLFQRIRDLLVNSRDLVLVRNTLITRHMEMSAQEIERTATDYATRHEERLVEGLCLERASPLFIAILDAFKRLASDASAIGRALGA